MLGAVRRILGAIRSILGAVRRRVLGFSSIVVMGAVSSFVVQSTSPVHWSSPVIVDLCQQC